MLTIIFVILVFSFLVIIHELGHFLVAKREGVKVEEFGVGFPPSLWSFQHGETKYSINLIPLGGFVRMYGEEGEGKGDPRSFISQTIGAKIRIIIAGVVMHLILAYILIAALFWAGSPLIIGRASDYPGVTVKYQRVVISKISDGSPAKAAGIQLGDQVIQINGSAYGDDEIVRSYLLTQAGKKIDLTIKRGEKRIPLQATLRDKSQASKGLLGVQLGTVQYVRMPSWEVPFIALIEQLRIMWLILSSLGGLVTGLFSHNSTAVEGVAGPIGITAIIAKVSALGLEPLIRLIVVLTMSLAVFNILPIPALDGGRLLFLVLEKVRSQPIKASVENTIHATGFWILIALILVISVWDVIRLSTGKLGI